MCVYEDYIKLSSSATTAVGSIVAFSAMMTGSSFLILAGMLTTAAGFGVGQYLEYYNTITRCNALDSKPETALTDQT